MNEVDCEERTVEKVDLISDINTINGRKMATSNLLDDIGLQLQAGKRQDLFWVAMAIIASAVLISISIFGKKRRRRR